MPSADAPATLPTLPALPPRGWADYAAALDRVGEFMHANLAQPLTVERLAEVACLSAGHFHRVWHAMRGETLAASVQRLRLQRAAWWLARSDEGVDAIARRCGFSGAATLTRAFGAAYGSTPAAYRRNGPHAHFRAGTASAASQPGGERSERPPGALQVELRPVAAQPLWVVAHRGPYIGIGAAFDRVVTHLARQRRGAAPAAGTITRMVGIYLDDPAAVSASALRSFAGIALGPDAANVELRPPLQPWLLPAGLCAVLRYQGPYASMQPAYRWLFGQWLPQSGHAPAAHPVYEDYLNHPGQVAPDQLLTEICLPLLQPRAPA